MNEEQKAVLIEWAHKWIEPARRTVENNPHDDSAKASLALYEIALASLTAQPVLYALRFKNLDGRPEKLINDNCLFRTRERASQYGKGGNYVTQNDGRIEWVPNPSLDPEVVPLYTKNYQVEE